MADDKRFPGLGVGEVANEMDALEDACTSLVRAYKEAHPDMPDAAVAYAGFGIAGFMMTAVLKKLGLPHEFPVQH